MCNNLQNCFQYGKIYFIQSDWLGGDAVVINIQDDILKLQALGLLDDMLADKTTGKHILWASDAYSDRGPAYEKNREITPALITGDNSDVIKIRARKSMEQQTERTRKHGEVFTPVWVCKKMNDHIDEVWFRRKTGFNKTDNNGHVFFPKGKTWKQYADNRRLEITCGEAPFLVSRYAPETGEVIPIPQRIGILDRKLRVVSENAETEEEWFTWAIRALEATYGYEYQGDSLLIGRVNILMTFGEYLSDRWNRRPTPEEYKGIIRIITWNIWQMDGLTGLVPYAGEEDEQLSLFATEPKGPSECRFYNWRQQNSFSYLSVKGENARMKFKYITGNPPYQEEMEGTSDTPVYNHFMDAAYEISDKVELITPARFLFNAGKTPKAWNRKMLDDKHLKVMFYDPNPNGVFPGNEIKGGVVITYRDKDKDFGAIEVFTPYDELNSIMHKVKPLAKNYISDIVYAPESYKFTSTLYLEHPEIKEMTTMFKGKEVPLISKGHDYDLTSNIFDKLKGIVFFDEKPVDKHDYIQVFGRQDNARAIYFIDVRYVAQHENLNAYKLLFPKANGSGKFGEPMSVPAIGYPGMAHTQTFLSMGVLQTEGEAKALMKYVQCKFARALLGILKVTQDNKKSVWKYVPLQDFTSASDIDWSKSIPEIDQQLYAKYYLSEEEIAFIESHVKEMTLSYLRL